MTPSALQRLARRALLIRAKRDVGIAALLPATSIQPDGEPSWPIITIEAPNMLRIRNACPTGAAISFDVHGFAGPRYNTAGAVIETGYDHASRLGSAIEACYADNHLTLEGGPDCRIRFSDTRLLRDEGPDDWHWFGQLNCRVIAA